MTYKIISLAFSTSIRMDGKSSHCGIRTSD